MPRFFKNQKGIIHFLPLLLLLAGIIAGVYLVQQTQIFKPKATAENIEWVISDQDPDNCVTYKDGKKVTTCPKVKFKINVPITSSIDNSTFTPPPTNENENNEENTNE